MDKKHSNKLKYRLGSQIPGCEDSEAADAQLRQDFLEYAPMICELFEQMNRDLLLVLKTNNYLRTIDMRLGSPGNSFRVVNDATWQVYSREIMPSKRLSSLQMARESFRYWMFKMMMLGFAWVLRFRQFCGLSVAQADL